MIKPKVRHKQFAKTVVDVLAKGGTQADAYQKVYPEANKQSAIQQASRLMARNEIKANIAAILDKKYLTEDTLCAKLKRMTNAKKAIVVDKAIEQVQDNSTQLEALKVGLKLHGHLKSGISIQEDNRQVNIGTDSVDHRQLRTLTDRLGQLHTLMNSPGQGQQDGEVGADADFSVTDDTMGVDDAVFSVEVEEGAADVGTPGQTDSGVHPPSSYLS